MKRYFDDFAHDPGASRHGMSNSCFEAGNGCGMGDTDTIVSWYCRGYGHGAIGTHGSLKYGGIGYGRGHTK